MFIRVERSTLLSAIEPCLGSVATRSASEVLSCLQLKTDVEKKRVVVTAFDNVKGVRNSFPAEILEEGCLLVDAQKLNSMARALPEGEISIVADANFVVTISAANAKYEISGLNGTMFPAMPLLAGDRKFTVSQGLLKKMLQQVAFACAVIDQRPVLTGIFFEANETTLRMCGCDGYRIALRNETGIEGLNRAVEFLFPARSAQELIKLLGDDEKKTVRIELALRHVIVIFEEFTFFSRYVDGEYIDYHKSIPKEHNTRVSVSIGDALGCFERCALLIDERVKSPITLDIAEDHIHVTCRTANGRIDEEIPVKTEGELMRVGFNNRFLLDALRAAAAAGAEDLELELTSPLASMAIRSPGNDRFLYMVVPMRLTT